MNNESTKSSIKASQDHKRGIPKRAFTFNYIIFAFRFWYFFPSFNNGCIRNLTWSIPFLLSVAINLRMLRLPVFPFLFRYAATAFLCCSDDMQKQSLLLLMGKFKILRPLFTFRAYWERIYISVRGIGCFWLRVWLVCLNGLTPFLLSNPRYRLQTWTLRVIYWDFSKLLALKMCRPVL